MRVLIATGLYPPEIGGPATYTKLFEERLPGKGIEVSVLPFNTVRHLPPGIRHLVYAIKLAIHGRSADVILVQDTVSTGLPAALVAFVLRRKLAVRVPGDYAWEQGAQRFGVKDSLDEFQSKHYGMRVAMLRFVQRFVVRSSHAVIVPSDYLGRIVRGWGVVPVRIYNGIDTTKSESVRDENVIVSAGRLVPWKGFTELIEVAKKHPEWKLLIIGDGPEKSRLRELAKDAPHIELVGNLSNKELRLAMARASVFVLNSTYEGLSHILIEACAEGAPIIATNVGGNSEVVRDAGMLISKGELEPALYFLLNNEKERERLSQAARIQAQEFSIDACVEKTASLLKSL